MAPNTGDSNVNDEQPAQLVDGTSGQKQDREEGIWSSILDSVSSSKVIPTKNAIILGSSLLSVKNQYKPRFILFYMKNQT